MMRHIATGAAGAALAAAATIGSAAPAQAEPVAVGNLVNVQIPINAAANICVGDVTVAVIAEVLDGGSPFECTARSGKQELVVTQ